MELYIDTPYFPPYNNLVMKHRSIPFSRGYIIWVKGPLPSEVETKVLAKLIEKIVELYPSSGINTKNNYHGQ
jgi:hypothetical protein